MDKPTPPPRRRRQSVTAKTKGPLVPIVLLGEFDIHHGSVIAQTEPPGALQTIFGLDEDNGIANLMLPEGAQKQTWDYTAFMLNRKPTLAKITLDADDWTDMTGSGDLQTKPKPVPMAEDQEVIFCFGLIHTKKEAHKETNRGATIKCLTIGCVHQFFHIYQPLIWDSLLKFFGPTKPGPELLKQIYNEINDVKVSKALDYRERYQRFWTASNSTERHFTSKALFLNKEYPIALPMHYLSEEVAEASLYLLLHTFQDKILLIYNAILLERRVMFFGHDVPTWLLCRYVFSACLLVSPLSGVLHERAYPYVNLGSFDFLLSEGYIIGVSNPFMKEKVKFDCWDVLCDITTGEVIDTNAPTLFSKVFSFGGGAANINTSQAHTEFLQKILLGLKGDMSEYWFRKQFYVFTMGLITDTLSTEMGNKVITNQSTELINKFQTKRSYQKWANENMHLLSSTYLVANCKISRNMWDFSQLLRKKSEPQTSQQPWILTVAKKIIELAVDDDQVMEIFSLLTHHKIQLVDLIMRSLNFPADVKKDILQIVDKQNNLINSMLIN